MNHLATAPPQPPPAGPVAGLRFYLGTHKPYWLAHTDVPLCVSIRQLRRKELGGELPTRLPRARGPWVLDSGGFTELQVHGRWTIPPERYAAEVRRCATEIGNLVWAAPQDYMCEPVIINGGRVGPLTFVGTGLSVAEHQARTIDSYLTLRELAPDLPWLPVLQGFEDADYFTHLEQYAAAGVDLTTAPLVGLGSVCRRQSTNEIRRIVEQLADLGVDLHAFGVKNLGLAAYAPRLRGADSQAWSAWARLKRYRRPGCRHGRDGTGNCANCLLHALEWRAELLTNLATGQLQLDLSTFDTGREGAR